MALAVAGRKCGHVRTRRTGTLNVHVSFVLIRIVDDARRLSTCVSLCRSRPSMLDSDEEPATYRPCTIHMRPPLIPAYRFDSPAAGSDILLESFGLVVQPTGG